jgi:hypothetical protein
MNCVRKGLKWVWTWTEFGEGLIGSEISAQNPPEIKDSGRSLIMILKRNKGNN